MVRAAVQAGANSVYVGPHGWSRCESAYELPHQDVDEAHRVAHDHGARLRIALAFVEPRRAPDGAAARPPARAQSAVAGGDAAVPVATVRMTRFRSPSRA